MNYVSQVADHLLIRSVCLSIVPPEIYTKIADWEKRGIPVEIVLSSIDELSKNYGAIDELNGIVGRRFRSWLQVRSN